MARVRNPLVAVAAKGKAGTHLTGLITASHLLRELVGAAGP
ncbi:hypothetical protein SsS58_05420 [Streptomyces scabiei]|uniref:Uncharacterized protein n=1 Tax=Streptomyces scabiei TaxID=1930 RepID=A0A124C4N5_STRSC|nr:hypothetical protein SsS58_05420 [Streptomyces scabiei]